MVVIRQQINPRSYLILVDQPHVLGDILLVPWPRFGFSDLLQVQPRQVEFLFAPRDLYVEIDETLLKFER